MDDGRRGVRFCKSPIVSQRPVMMVPGYGAEEPSGEQHDEQPGIGEFSPSSPPFWSVNILDGYYHEVAVF